MENYDNKLLDWCKFFNDPYSKEVEEIAARNNDIKEAKEELDRLNNNPEMHRLVKLKEMVDRGEASELDFVKQKALMDGMEKEKIAIAKKLLKLGISIEDISKATDLFEREILELKNSI